MQQTKPIFMFLVCGILLLCRCSSNPVVTTGSGHEWEAKTTAVFGYAVDGDGIVLSGANVFLRPSNYLCDLWPDESCTTIDCTTDQHGKFEVFLLLLSTGREKRFSAIINNEDIL